MNKISPERAGAIALAVVTATWPKAGLHLKREVMEALIARLVKQTGIDKERIVRFYAEVILAPVFQRCTGEKISVQFQPAEDDEGYNSQQIALALFKAKGLTIQVDFQTRLDRMAKETGITIEELKSFFVQEVISPSPLSI